MSCYNFPSPDGEDRESVLLPRHLFSCRTRAQVLSLFRELAVPAIWWLNPQMSCYHCRQRHQCGGNRAQSLWIRRCPGSLSLPSPLAWAAIEKPLPLKQALIQQPPQKAPSMQSSGRGRLVRACFGPSAVQHQYRVNKWGRPMSCTNDCRCF